MSVALKNMLNAMYSRDLSRKVRSAMKTHAKNGEYMPAFPKYGYIKDPEDKHHLVIDPEAAEIVKLIFTMAADGKTKGQIAKHLNETHVLTCREYMCRKGIKMHRENEKKRNSGQSQQSQICSKMKCILEKLFGIKREWQEQEAINWFPMIKKSGLL